MNQQQLEGRWSSVKGKVRERWGQLTDNDFSEAEGNIEQLVGVIQTKTGEARERIEDFLETALSDEGGRKAAETAREYAQQATAAVQRGYDQVAEQARAGYDQVAEQALAGYSQAEHVVKRNPLESVAVAFGAGIITGVIVGLVLRSK